MPELPYRTPAALRALGCLTVTLGLVLPAVLLLLDGAPTSGSWTMTIVLAIVAAVASNVSFEIRYNILLSPVGGPVVFAIIVCDVPQAMIVAIIAFGSDFVLLRSLGPKPGLKSSGIAAWTAGLTSWTVGNLGMSLDSPGNALMLGVCATTLYIILDAGANIIWSQGETKTGLEVWQYLLQCGPLDIAVTGVAVMLAAPFHDNPIMVATVLGGFTLAVMAVYRVTASERKHRTSSERLRDMFSRYVPASVAGQLAEGDGKVKLGGETRDISVLFCDIRGFTAWSEQHAAETVVQQLNQLLGALTDAVMSCEGTLDKFTGDGLMAFWGAPLEQPDHAQRACRAADLIHEALAACNELRAAEGMPPFAVGVGIATGPAVVGNIGHVKRLDYTAIGDTVNLAARLEAATKELASDTVISQGTAELLGNCNALGFMRRPDIRVKGKVEPVQVYGKRTGTDPRLDGAVSLIALEREQPVLSWTRVSADAIDDDPSDPRRTA